MQKKTLKHLVWLKIVYEMRFLCWYSRLWAQNAHIQIFHQKLNVSQLDSFSCTAKDCWRFWENADKLLPQCLFNARWIFAIRSRSFHCYEHTNRVYAANAKAKKVQNCRLSWNMRMLLRQLRIVVPFRQF